MLDLCIMIFQVCAKLKLPWVFLRNISISQINVCKIVDVYKSR